MGVDDIVFDKFYVILATKRVLFGPLGASWALRCASSRPPGHSLAANRPVGLILAVKRWSRGAL